MAEEFMTPSVENATLIHEIFLSFTAAGFSDDQALYLTSKILVAAMFPGGDS